MKRTQPKSTPAQLAGQAGRRARMQSRIKDLTDIGVSYDEAFDRVNRGMATEFANAKAAMPPGPASAARADSSEVRRVKLQSLIRQEMAGGASYDEAFTTVTTLHPELAGTPAVQTHGIRSAGITFQNANPIPGHKLSKDGSLVQTDGAATDKELMALGLPSVATPDQIHIFRAAKANEQTPEAAAVAVKMFIQACQASDGLNLAEAWKKADEYFPDVMKAARSTQLN